MRDRVANWQSALFRELDAARHRPFDWNGWTCFDFAASVYVALTDKPDPRAKFPTYQDEREAVVVMGRAGGPQAILTSVLGDSIHPSMAQRGDIVLGDFGSGNQPAICAGVHSFAPGAGGLVAIPTLLAIAAWEV